MTARGLGIAIFSLVAVASSACRHHASNKLTPQEAAWDAHHEAEREGRIDEAISGYRAQCDGEPVYVRACYDLARALFEAGRTTEAREAAERFIAENPSDALAPAAAAHLARSFSDEGEADVGIAALEALLAKISGEDVWDTVQYEIAGLHRIREDAAGESAALERIVKKGRWGSQLWDDSLWRLIEISREQGERDREKGFLARFVDSREESRLIGSYNSKYHDDALLRLGTMELEDGRLDRAYELFMQLAHWKTSRMRDDGYYWAAVVRVRQGKNGAACELMRELSEEMPESSSDDEAAELMRKVGCVESSAGSRANQ